MNNYIPNSYQTPNIWIDVVMPFLTSDEWRVVSYAMRHILGFQDRVSSRQHHMSLTMFENGYNQYPGCGLSKPTIRKITDELDRYGILKKIGKPTNAGQLYRLAESEKDIDLDGLRERAEQRQKSNKTRMKTVKRRKVVNDIAHQVVNDIVPLDDEQGGNDIAHKGAMTLHTGVQSHLPNQTHLQTHLQTHIASDNADDISPNLLIAVKDSDGNSIPVLKDQGANAHRFWDHQRTRLFVNTLTPLLGEAEKVRRQRSKDVASIIKVHMDTGVTDRRPGESYQNDTNREDAAAILDLGYTAEDVERYVKALKQGYWRGKIVPLSVIRKGIRAWMEDSDPEDDEPPNPAHVRHIAPDDEEEGDPEIRAQIMRDIHAIANKIDWEAVGL